MKRFTRFLCACLCLFPLVSHAETEDDLTAITAEFEPFRGKVVAGIPILCDTSFCSDTGTIALLLKVARLSDQKGQPLEPEKVSLAWSRLMRTGIFRTLTVEPVKSGNRMLIRFQGEGNVIIHNLNIEYATWQSRIYPKQFETEVKKRLLLKKGGNFPPKQEDGSYAPDDQSLLERQKRQIISLYEQQGFIDTDVEISANYYGHNNKRVDVTITIKEGHQPKVGSVLLEGNKTLPYWEVVSPISTAEKVDFWENFFDIFSIGWYDRRALKEQVAEIEELYREKGYYGARARLERLEGAQDGVIEIGQYVRPIVRVTEGPKVDITFEGNDNVSDDTLREQITFLTSGAFDETEVQLSAQAMTEYYQTNARYYTQVTGVIEWKSDDHAIVHFLIKETPKLYVRQIKIKGSEYFSEQKLKDTIDTKGVAPYWALGFGASAGVLQDAQITNDLLAIKALYKSEGFTNVEFLCAPPGLTAEQWGESMPREVGEDKYDPAPKDIPGIWSPDPINNTCFKFYRDTTDSNLLNMEIELREGLQTTTGGFDLNPILKKMDVRYQDDAYSILQNIGITDEFRAFKKDIPLTNEKIDTVRNMILRHYQRSGYLQAQVTPSCPTLDGQTSCSMERLYGKYLKQVKFNIEQGPLTLVDGILIRGNLRTKSHIIAHELQLKDDSPLGTEDLFMSQANLRSLGIFDSVKVETISSDDVDVEQKNAAVLVQVEETRYQQVDAYVGLQLESNISSDVPLQYLVGASIRDRNFLGRALELGLGINHANRWNTPQDLGGDDAIIEVGPFFKDQRFLSTRLDLSVEAKFSREQTAERDRYEEAYSASATVGYDFYNLSYPREWGHGLRSTVTTEWRRERRRALTLKGERPAFGEPTQSVGISPAFTWDHRDSPLHPTRGWMIIGSAELLAADIKQSDLLPSLSFKETLTAEYIQPLFKRHLLIVPMLRLGAVQTDKEEEDLKSGFLFKAGGDGVTYPVRGYSAASIDACNGVEGPGCSGVFAADDDEHETALSVGGKYLALGTLEFRVPTQVVDNLWLALFSDVAAIAPSLSDFSADRVYPSVGLGIRYLITGQIPLRFDIGYPLRDTVFGEREVRFHFNLFYSL